jgi:hypothetical protein
LIKDGHQRKKTENTVYMKGWITGIENVYDEIIVELANDKCNKHAND